ncbi:hypothetical protein E4T56_gene2662 [Termitomyces sp. T112]|nr:hypothetical protein E4T56_gene2662 [Termitomyces sp. T112]
MRRPILSSCSFDNGRIHHINNVPNTATSSYITIPPPFTHEDTSGSTATRVHHPPAPDLIDAYAVTPTGLTDLLTDLSSRSQFPASFCGDTLHLSPSIPLHPVPLALFAITRGTTSPTRGWLSTFFLDADGMFVDRYSAEY